MDVSVTALVWSCVPRGPPEAAFTFHYLRNESSVASTYILGGIQHGKTLL